MHTGVEKVALQSFLPVIKGVDKEGDEESVSVCDVGVPGGFESEVVYTGADKKGHANGTVKPAAGEGVAGVGEAESEGSENAWYG